MEKKSLIRDLIAFWIFGLANNFAYVIMLSAAEDIIKGQTASSYHENSTKNTSVAQICRPVLPKPRCEITSTGAILLADIIPALIIKLFCPFLMDRVPFGFRHFVVCAMFRNALLSMLIVPILFAFAYWLLLTPSPSVHRMQIRSPSTWIVPVPSEKVDLNEVVAEQVQRSSTTELSFGAKMRLTVPLLRLMLPMCVVYFAEYLINSGLYQLLHFDCVHGFGLNEASQFRWYQTLYQLGVFISRSSVTWLELPTLILYLLAVLQCGNVLIFYCQALFHYIPHIGVVFTIILVEGLFGGASYVNTFTKIHKKAPKEIREFSLSIVASSDSLGVTLAGFVSILLHNHICILQQNESKLMAPYMEFLFDLDHFRYSGFLIVINNKMRITGESCRMFGNLFSFELNGQWTGIACSHYMVRYEPAPLHLRMVSPVFFNLFVRQLLTIMLTVVRFSCPPAHEYLRQCPNHPLCIPAKLFCDSMDNCGMGSDELWCPVPPLQQNPSTVSSTTFDELDQLNSSSKLAQSMYIFFDTVQSLSALWAFVLVVLVVSFLMTLTGITVRKRNRRRRYQDRPTIRNLFGSVMPFSGGSQATAGSAGQLQRSSNDDETMGLLTLGLKNVLQSLPDQHWHNAGYEGIMETEGGQLQGHQNENGATTAEQYLLTINQQEVNSAGQRRVHWLTNEVIL
uniref:Battenin n=1 Tax=Globodera rostochiensis TaxID=31243 RepID=A0A914HKC2_GLORO